MGKTEVKKKLLKGNISKVTEISKENSNIIKDIKYLSEDNLGNTYKINAKTGEINNDNPDIILLKNVIARISIVNSDDIFIYADFAKYNNKNYNTNFYENIKVEYIDHKTGIYNQKRNWDGDKWGFPDEKKKLEESELVNKKPSNIVFVYVLRIK